MTKFLMRLIKLHSTSIHSSGVFSVILVAVATFINACGPSNGPMSPAGPIATPVPNSPTWTITPSITNTPTHTHTQTPVFFCNILSNSNANRHANEYGHLLFHCLANFHVNQHIHIDSY